MVRALTVNHIQEGETMKTALKLICLSLLVLCTSCYDMLNDLRDDIYSDCRPILKWTRLFSKKSGGGSANGVVVDNSGNSYVTGAISGGIDDLGGIGLEDVFVIKYNSIGTKQWSRLLGGASNQTRGMGIALDGNGYVYITGWTGVNLDSLIKTGMYDLFIVKYDTEGVKQWTKLLGVASSQTEANSIALDHNGNIYVAGRTNGNLGGETVSNTSGCDLAVTKFNASGSRLWTRLLGTGGGYVTVAYSIAVDTDGNCFVAGQTCGNLDGQSLSGTPDGSNSDMFIVKYDTSGTKKWTKLIGAGNGTQTMASGVALDSSGNSYVTGGTYGNLDGNLLTGYADGFVAKFNTSGIKQWVKLYGVAGYGVDSRAIAVDESGNIYTGSSTDGSIDGQMLSGTMDAMVMKLDPSGEKQWTRLLGGSGDMTNGLALALDKCGYIRVAGCTYVALDGQTLNGGPDLFVSTRPNK